ncbi:MAG: uL15 family ribosomal protein [Nanoarchaeota archaeon]|nr:uL15 family ribosomal protein [Nanoarchaeota archaeon]
MTVNTRKKFSRQRASHTHGWGSKKKHRGAGSRGGKGMAGSGKRADQKKTLFWKDTKYFGKHGFKVKGVKVKGININYIEEKLEKLLKKNMISKEGAVYVIDLGKMGYGKLLGTGKVINKFKINVKYASASAIDKIKKAGGEVIVVKKEVKSSS